MIDTSHATEFRYPVSTIRDQDEAEFGITPSQTVGPYVHIGLTLDGSEHLVPADTADAVEITLTVIDGDGAPVTDAMVEIWQAGPDGVFNAPADPRTGDDATVEDFRGLGRGMADGNGSVTFTTVPPGAVELAGQEVEAPHLKVGVFARGMLERLYTRLYFPENTQANAGDPVLRLVDGDRRGLLVAEPVAGGYHLEIVMQHQDPSRETPFFRV